MQCFLSIENFKKGLFAPYACGLPVAVARRVVIDGLGHAIEKETDPHTAGKEHDEPRDIVKLGLLVRPTQFEMAILAKVQVDDEDDPDVQAADVEPGEVIHDPCFPVAKGNLFSLEATPSHEAPDETYGRHRDNGVEPNLAHNGQLEFCPYAQILQKIVRKGSKATNR